MNITVEQELNFPDTTFLGSVLSVAQVKSYQTFTMTTHSLNSRRPHSDAQNWSAWKAKTVIART